MRYRTKVLLILLVTGSILLPTLGCTLIGLGIGAIADSGKPKKKPVPGWEWQTLKRNEKLTIIRVDGTQDSGRFVTVAESEAAAFAARFIGDRNAGSAGALLPRPGDTLSITTIDGDELRCTLIGYDQRYRLHDPAQKDDTTESMTSNGNLTCLLTVQNVAGGAVQRIDSRIIEQMMSHDSDVLSGEDITTAVRNHRVPLLSTLVILNDSSQIAIPVDQIDQVWIKNKVHGKTIGLIIGATLDAAAIAIAIAFASSDLGMGSWSTSGGGGSYSCPFVYSFDGRKWHKQAEVFGGAIFQAAQRTDWVTLDSLRETNGMCRLRITNELEETQYVDELKLLAVDHPAGSRVVPTFDGRPRVVSDPILSVRAYDDRGANLSDALSKIDDHVWVSNPFGHDPSDMKQVRDGLVLEFPSQPGADSATLILNGQNSRWSAEMLGHVLTLQGDSLDAWYQTLNNSAKERSRVLRAMIREGMLLVKVWEQGAWREAGMIWDIGPAVPRDVAVVIQLKQPSDSVLRVRLESTAGFWMINRVAIDYSTNAPVSVAELSATRAVDYRGIDLLQSLSDVDGRYYEMPTTMDWAEVEFEVPSCMNGVDRSYVVQCNGYYMIHVSGAGKPRSGLVARLLDEPGAFGRYTLELLEQYVLASLSAADTAETR